VRRRGTRRARCRGLGLIPNFLPLQRETASQGDDVGYATAEDSNLCRYHSTVRARPTLKGIVALHAKAI
jgi:hypothetical protein